MEPGLDGLFVFLSVLYCGLILLLRLLLVGIGLAIPLRLALWITGFLHFLRFRRKVGIESAQCGVVHGFG